jgi:hypothetical protein
LSKIALSGNASGTGTFTLAAPNSNSDRTLTLPDNTGTIVTTGSSPSFPSTIGVGGATPAASGAGITFPATQSASSNANTLDDYEEGTWTPVFTGISGSAGTVAYTSSGTYTKVGRLVSIRGTITLSNKGSWSGKILITGTPFSQSTSEYPTVPVGIFENYTTNVLSVSGYLNGTSSQIIPLHQTAASVGNTETLVSDVSATWRWDFSASYFV